MGRFLLLFIALLVFLNACVPDQIANPGEVIYQFVPGQVDPLFSGNGGLTPIAAKQVAPLLVTYFSLQSSAAPGYEQLDFQFSDEVSPGIRELTFISQSNDKLNKIISIWRVVDRGVNFVGVFAETYASDHSLNVVEIENNAFRFLDRKFKRISSAR